MDELLHYGVKGMKWGKRKNPTPYENSKRYKKLKDDYQKKGRSEEESVRAAQKRLRLERSLMIVGGLTLTAVVGYGIYKHVGKTKLHDYLKNVHDVPDSLFSKKLSDLDDTDLFLPKGTKFHRMSANPDISSSGMNYMSYKKKDVNRYRSAYDYIQPTVKQYYDVTLESTKDLKALSKKKQVETFSKLLDDKDFIDGLKGLNYKYSSINGQIDDIVRNSSKEDAAKSLFPLFANSMGSDSSNKAVDIFIKSVKEQGFNALIDTNDQALKVAESPIISLSGETDLVKKHSKRVTQLIKTMSAVSL